MTEGSSFNGAISGWRPIHDHEHRYRRRRRPDGHRHHFTQRGRFSASTSSATINWGDGTTSPNANIVSIGGGNFHVTGNHTYVTPGSYSIATTVTDNSGGNQTTSKTIFFYNLESQQVAEISPLGNVSYTGYDSHSPWTTTAGPSRTPTPVTAGYQRRPG